MGRLGTSSRVRASASVLWTDLGGEIALLLPAEGRAHLVSGAGAALWPLLLSEERTVGELCGLIEAGYHVDPETCREEVTALLDELASLGLVEVSG